MGSVIGIELRALWLEAVGEHDSGALPKIGLDCWSPNVGIVRDPRWGESVCMLCCHLCLSPLSYLCVLMTYFALSTGRNMETPSEDPLINSAYGIAYTVGLQNGSDPRYIQAIPTLKHYDANSLEGTWGPYNNITRHNVNAVISTYDLASTYLVAFRESIVEGGALGVMCSYVVVDDALPSLRSCLFT
jgi:hypothetical protein